MTSDRDDAGTRRYRLQEELRGLSFGALMRGSVVERRRRCGRPNCACAKDKAAWHGGKFLTVQLGGRTHALHLRPEDQSAVQEAIATYKRVWDIINELTECELADLRRRARERRRSRQRRRQ